MSFRVLIVLALALGEGAAAADPALDRVLTAPTAWLPAAGVVVGDGGLDQRGDASIVLRYGLGGLAAIELGDDTDVRACSAVCDGAQRGQPVASPRAAFRIGAHQDAWFSGQPALAIGVARWFGRSQQAAEAYIAASRLIGPVALHAGASWLDARSSEASPRLGPTVRPFGGAEFTPPQYPLTTLVADIAWLPLLESAAPARTEWLIGWGVRYQALAWGSIELDVRHRQDEGLGASTVMVRVHGVWKL
jgi:hypothetical protein